MLCRRYTALKSQNVLKPTRYHRPEVPSAVLPCRQKGPRSCRPLTSGTPLGHPKALKIAVARAVCAKVRARAPLNAKKRTFGGPRVRKGAKMEPKWKQMGASNVSKTEVSQKSAKCGLDLLFTIYSHYWHPLKTLLFHTSKQQKCRSFSHGASDGAPEL